MKCCNSCFSDLVLTVIINDKSERGNCDYCESEDELIIDVSELTEEFNKLMKYYAVTEPYEDYHPEIHDDPTEFGDSLINLINEDWNIFSKELVGTGTDESLLFDILDINNSDHTNSWDLYSRISDSFSFVHPLEDWEVVWEKFKNELKHENRFFPKTQTEVFNKSFDEALDIRRSYIRNRVDNLYRARIGEHPFEKMLAPPVELAKGGRANPQGISYLYCARDERTAIAEVRPWKGAQITVAGIKVKRELKVVDLFKEPLSPFSFDSPYQALEIDKLLTYFSKELSTPVDPNKSEIEYLPTQYITELIKSKGFDGILFDSAIGPGTNIVIFDEKNAEVTSTQTIKVNKITYD